MIDKKSLVAVLSEHTLFRRGISELLRLHGFRHVAEYATTAALRAAPSRPEIVVVDLDHEPGDTMTLVRSLRHELFDSRIVVIGTALRQGASDAPYDAGVDTPGADIAALVSAAGLHHRSNGRSLDAARQQRLWGQVTPRQRDVLRWLATGADNRAIGRKLRIGVRAVKAHVSGLLQLFGVANRTQLALLADRAGLQPPARARA